LLVLSDEVVARRWLRGRHASGRADRRGVETAQASDCRSQRRAMPGPRSLAPPCAPTALFIDQRRTQGERSAPCTYSYYSYDAPRYASSVREPLDSVVPLVRRADADHGLSIVSLAAAPLALPLIRTHHDRNIRRVPRGRSRSQLAVRNLWLDEARSRPARRLGHREGAVYRPEGRRSRQRLHVRAGQQALRRSTSLDRPTRGRRYRHQRRPRRCRYASSRGRRLGGGCALPGRGCTGAPAIEAS
jgi:hypothetical protein